jgi:UDP-2,3-diacylglucosamine hydrolase
LAKPLNERLALARAMRTQSESQKQSGMDYADADTALCVQWLSQAQANRLIHGHTHRPAEHDLGDGLSRWVLPDWDCEHSTPRGGPLRLTATGLSRPGLSLGLG